MMDLQIGVGKISLRLRHSRSLKDKRKVVQGLVQRMRNLGASVTETGDRESPKTADIGFCFAGADASRVQDCFHEIEKMLWGDFEVLAFDKEFVDYAHGERPLFSDSILDERDPEE